MEPEGALPHLQVPATYLYPESAQSSTYFYIPLPEDPSLSHLTSCTPTKYNLYLANSLATAISEPAIYRLLTFHHSPHYIFYFKTYSSVFLRNNHHYN
jgi:hypothetical protein